ncbi:hypothetical protein FRACA_20002 [Frankia canadensis]|uniref:Uncharacterized protein n=1 Tax=Frankia canadensis TaxID=1836972 RepID=A0A2I2KPM0_9ACTN|nr:hypothetical protein FRACA_20002 [Frankia canadensis]SOU54896.1 hypothetical protein FRACA_20002 [Frankia canadensis]
MDELMFPEVYALGEAYEKVNHEGDTGSDADT